jgi:hypothetical protein
VHWSCDRAGQQTENGEHGKQARLHDVPSCGFAGTEVLRQDGTCSRRRLSDLNCFTPRGGLRGSLNRRQFACIAAYGASAHAPAMLVVTEEDEAAIRAVYEQRGEFAAAIELRQRFPGVTDNAQARECARTIAGWKPLPLRPVKPKVPRLRRML